LKLIGGNKYDLEPFAVGPDGKKANHVQAIINILSHPDCSHGVKSASSKHSKCEDQAYFELRKYFEVHHGNTDAKKELRTQDGVEQRMQVCGV
jgi:hypothetical protein